MSAENDMPMEVLAETENFSVWVSQESEGESTYHLEIGTGNITIHFYPDEWDEFMVLISALPQIKKK